MTGFFVTGSDAGPVTEAAYDRLRERSRIAVGCPARSRRIFKLECRLDGQDCEAEVGRPLPNGRGVVVAILDHGRDESYAVYTDAGRGGAVRVARPVYSVTEFA